MYIIFRALKKDNNKKTPIYFHFSDNNMQREQMTMLISSIVLSIKLELFPEVVYCAPKYLITFQ